MLMTLGIGLVLVLTVATGYFVAQEFAYVSVDRGHLQRLADEGDAAARRALAITARLSFTLSGAQFGITVTALLVGYFGEPLIGDGLAELLGFTSLPYAVRLAAALAAVLVFSTVLQMILGELAPKNLAIARPVALARALSRSTLAYLAVAGPLVRFFDGASNRVLRLLGIEPVEELASGATTEDLERIVAESRRSGHLDDGVSALLDRGLAFRRLTAGLVMTPRVRVDSVDADAPVDEVTRLLATSGHSRFPVTRRDVDDVVGVIGIAEVLDVPRAARATTTAGSVASEPLRIPTTLTLPAVLETLRRHHRQLAVVVDEYGGFAGVVSFEDLAEEVVGDILDEDDTEPAPRSAPAGAPAPPRPPGSVAVAARTRLDELYLVTGLRLPTDEHYDTVGGLVLARLGRMAVVGDEVTVPADPEPSLLEDAGPRPEPARLRIRVDAVRRQVPEAVTIRPLAPAPDGEPEEGDR